MGAVVVEECPVDVAASGINARKTNHGIYVCAIMIDLGHKLTRTIITQNYCTCLAGHKHHGQRHDQTYSPLCNLFHVLFLPLVIFWMF